MPFQSVPNTASFTCVFTANETERVQFTLYVNNDAAAWGATELTAKADNIRDAIVASYIPVLSDEHAFLGVIARDLEVEFGRVEEIFEAAPVAGGVASPALPGNVAVVGTLKSATGAPRRGRVNLLPPTEAQVDGNSLTGGAQAALQGALEAIDAAATSGTGNAHVIVSRYSGSELADPDQFGQVLKVPTKRGVAITAEVASVAVRGRLGSQRRRMPRS